jgi:hypothetical protein
MATLPTDRISAGLDARARAAAPRQGPRQEVSLIPPNGRVVARRTAGDLSEQAATILDTERQVKALIASAREEMRTAARDIEARWASETAIPRDVSQPLGREKARQARDQIRAEHREMLERVIRDLAGAHDALVSQSPLHHSRMQSLSLVGIGTQERANLEVTVAKTGRVGLVSLGQHALAGMVSADPEERRQGTLLASVLALELGTRPPEERPFAPSILADVAPLADHDEASRAIRSGQSAITNIGKLVNDFLTGRDNEPRSISRILDERELGLPDGAEEE